MQINANADIVNYLGIHGVLFPLYLYSMPQPLAGFHCHSVSQGGWVNLYLLFTVQWNFHSPLSRHREFRDK